MQETRPWLKLARVCIFMYVYEHIIAVFPHVLLLHKWFCCSSVHKGREEEDKEERRRRLALQLLKCFRSFDYLDYAGFFFYSPAWGEKVGLLGEQKWLFVQQNWLSV